MVGATGLRFLGNGSIEPVIDKLDRNLELDLLGPWTLDHRSFVETAASAGEQQSRKWLQVLTLSYHPGEETYVIITQPNDGNAHTQSSNTIRIPDPQAPNFVALLSEKLAPMWTPYDHHSIASGQAFEAEEYRIRIGEITRQQYRGHRAGAVSTQDSGWVTVNEAQGGTVVVSVEVIGEKEALQMGSEAKSEELVRIEAEMIQNLYAQLGLDVVDDVGSVVFEVAEGRTDEARRWCEGFRVHGRGLRSITVKAEQ